ncbi:MAG TPA: hypothetical protein VGN18_04640 [Jatrophihabitans sp.]|jgi:hypothetical protein|uniref:hypothetical protein n=1 Tax=Jatrophihabitans sp. TaxID=1932789 RepID=UPI002E09E31D|nr:hypothetical protein [Jatrophihabitans sp.]
MDAAPDTISFTSGVYWRRSPINGRKTVPVVLQLVDGRLRMWTATEMVFDVPTGEVSAKFSKLSTMFLTVSGRKFSIVGIGASLSPKFSDRQLAALEAARADAQRRVQSPGPAAAAGGVSSVVGGVAGGATALAGLGLAVADLATMRRSIRPWREIFGHMQVAADG